MDQKWGKESTKPLVSVVIPVYNTEKYLERCIESILLQTYTNLEIIIVNDSSTDDSAKIINHYSEQDSRIITVPHETNKGLFEARISGVNAAHGKYIGFVDSDDYISIDWFRKLVNKAERTQADIVAGEWSFDNNGVSKTYLNLDPFRVNNYSLSGNEIMEAFMEQKGYCYSWTVVWNKLYTLDLWKKCLEDFTNFSHNHGKMNIWEDITFSTALWCKAKHVCNVHGTNYFYFRHEDSLTGGKTSREKINRYIYDSSSAMEFMKDILTKSNRMKDFQEHFVQWKNNAACILYRDIVHQSGLTQYEKSIRDAFQFEGDFNIPNNYFYSLQTPLTDIFNLWENMIKTISSPEIRIVSFDVFDTLVQRPFLTPSDMFFLLSYELNQSLSSYVDFHNLRIDAEQRCRQKKELNHPTYEDITLDEIYEELAESTSLSGDLLLKMKAREIEMELEFTTIRKSGKELYDLAKEKGKQIILVSDMYLPKEIIEKILKKNQYSGYEKIHISSDIMKTKGKGTIFKYIQKDLKITKPSCIFHIGDNNISDVTNTQSNGWQSAHLARSADMIQNFNPGIYTGESFSRIFTKNTGYTDYTDAMIYGYPALKSVIALAGNRFFDNPYVSFNPGSDFNADPAMIGYYLLGPHLLALSQWIEKTTAERNIHTIHFVARDGYLVKSAFDIINHSSVKTNYIRLSRKALMLADVNTTDDLYSFFRKTSILNCTPQKLITYLTPIISEKCTEKEIKRILNEQLVQYTSTFQNETEFLSCMKILIEKVIDMSLLDAYKQNLKQYFSAIIQPGDFLFDVGYSGRPEAALSNLLGFPVGSLYIHSNSEISVIRQKKYNCPSESFYPYKPKITGVIREHVLMEQGPSTIGYSTKNGKTTPVFETYDKDYCSAFVTDAVQNAALEFIQDYKHVFGNYNEHMILLGTHLSEPWEYFLHYSKPFDRKIFSSVPFEDTAGGNDKLNALEFWNNDLLQHNLMYGKEFIENSKYIEDIYNSYSYKIGNIIIQPFHMIKELIRKFRA